MGEPLLLDEGHSFIDITGRKTRTFRGHTGFVQSVAFSPDGRVLAVGSSDMAIKLWDLVAGTASDLK
jgi:WD40 repeat protein